MVVRLFDSCHSLFKCTPKHFLVASMDELNSIKRSTYKKMPRTRTISLTDKIKNSPLSPTGSESAGHRLRSRRQCSIHSYLGSITDDDGHLSGFESPRESRELRSSTRQLLVSIFFHFLLLLNECIHLLLETCRK